ncbi:unnamed protein product [Haemonchus placei]|uniref:DNA-directed RNA polymerase n=1 Tax=Haemonchus placei TaxID=6290 RepID=A0A0N4XAR5_HAEPC|nr:unnamed protein product [Haemonchus placei]
MGKGGDAWRTALIADLEKELKAENKRFSILQGNRAQHAQLIRYAISEDLPSVISVIYQRVRVVSKRGKLAEEDDQFISFALTILQKSLETFLKDKRRVNTPEMLSTFFSFANLWDHMVFFGNDMRISSALLYNTFDRWSQLRAPDESSDEIDEILTRFERRLKKLAQSISLENSRLFLSDSEREQLLSLLADLDADVGKRKLLHDDTSYDKNTTLLDHLREPIPRESYHGNSYRLDDVPKETYIRKFPTQIATERAPWLYVENYTGTAKKESGMSAERLIESWDWLSKIRSTIEKLLDDRPQNPCKNNMASSVIFQRKRYAVNELNSLWCWMKYRIVLARHFRGQTLFFPHNMDFRGRVYPISPYLSHMGDDVNRCILKFAKGRPLGSRGFLWLKLHCINLTGKMKRDSIKDRLIAADQQLDDMVDSANHPLDGKGWWLESEEPWQTLAACMEIRDALAFPGKIEDFVSHLAVHQDGSCNGLQHYAALGRDEQGGLEVNLLKSETPNDVYSSVAMRVEQKRIEDEKGGPNMEIALRLREAMPQPVPRKVIKQTVMTTVYGVTLYGAALQIKRQLKALDIDNEETGKFAQYLTHKTFASLHDAFTCSMKLKDWFRDCAKGVSDLLQTMEWVTPLGLPVVQPYVIAKEKKGKVIHVPVSLKQVGAFPPNLVHSLDSCHMMLTSLDCSRRGVTFAAVHDCFWTHASTVDEMGELCREQFIRLHSEPIVQQCSDWFHSHYLKGPHIELMSPEDLAYFRKLFTCQVKPGDLDINQVKDSVYFFS